VPLRIEERANVPGKILPTNCSEAGHAPLK
jgi:hypothetical protein